MVLLFARYVSMSETTTQPGDATSAAWSRLIRVPQVLLAQTEAALRDEGLPPLGWYDALVALRRAGEAGIRPFELQRELGLEQYNISRLLDRMVAKGAVQRRRCDADARGQVVRITAEGRAMLNRMLPVYRGAVRRHFADRLGPGDAAALAQILARLEGG